MPLWRRGLGQTADGAQGCEHDDSPSGDAGRAMPGAPKEDGPSSNGASLSSSRSSCSTVASSCSPRGRAEAPARAPGGASEERLVGDVPALLDQMNGSAEQLNQLEIQLLDLRARRAKRSEKLQRLLNELDTSLGKSADIGHRYLEANMALIGSSDLVQAAAAEFKAATQCTVSTRAKEGAAQGDKAQLYHQALRSYCEAENQVDAARKKLGECLGEQAMVSLRPLFKELQHQKSRMKEEATDIALLEEQALAKKAAYNTAMDELGKLNDALHALRGTEPEQRLP